MDSESSPRPNLKGGPSESLLEEFTLRQRWCGLLSVEVVGDEGAGEDGIREGDGDGWETAAAAQLGPTPFSPLEGSAMRADRGCC